MSIDNELLEATASDAAAFVDAGKLAIDTGFRNLSNDIAHDLYGDGTGSRGQITSITSGVIVLTDPNSVVNFEVNMVLVSYSVSSTTYTQSTSAALGYVIAVDRSAGTVTVSAASGSTAGTPTNWSTSFPYMAVQGDIAFGALTLQTQFLKISGLAAWVPFVAPVTSSNFWGVDRSVDPTRLGGNRFDGSSESIEEALIDAATLVAREGGEPDMCFINFASYAALEKSLGAKVQYVSVKHDMADIAFAGITVNAPYGPITVIPDRSCPGQYAYLLDMSVWKLRTLNKCPHILTYGAEGLEGARISDQDALQIRLGMYGNLVCRAPGWNCVVKLSQ